MRYWFQSKWYGWYPASWQGWIIAVLYVGVTIYLYSTSNKPGSLINTLFSFFPKFLVLNIIFMTIYFFTGPRPKK